jgi:hypothetical protein
MCSVGRSTWRTQAWSQAGKPGEARFTLHLLNGVPAVVPRLRVVALDATADHVRRPGARWRQAVRGAFGGFGDVSGGMEGAWGELLWNGLRAMVMGATERREFAMKLKKVKGSNLDRAENVMFVN